MEVTIHERKKELLLLSDEMPLVRHFRSRKKRKKAAQAIADLVEQKYQIVITHSNGPQGRHDSDRYD